MDVLMSGSGSGRWSDDDDDALVASSQLSQRQRRIEAGDEASPVDPRAVAAAEATIAETDDPLFVKYEVAEKIGEGTFGVVFKGTERSTGKLVAIKKLRLSDLTSGISIAALREIKLLRELHQENVVELMDVIPHGESVRLVFEFAATDLEAVIKDPAIGLGPGEVKTYMHGLISGVAYLHSQHILHRDLKPGNVLITPEGGVKLGDFGLARTYGAPDQAGRMTNQVVTRWYRSPELLYGAKAYGPAIDMWSVGCIFAELMLRVPYFAGDSDVDQLSRIFAALGTPTEETWPGISDLPGHMAFTETKPTPLSALFTAASPAALDLLGKCLTMDPSKRISAQDALNHPYWGEYPKAVAPSALVLPSTSAIESANAAAARERERLAGTRRRLSEAGLSGSADNPPLRRKIF